ncbi:MAG: helicase C-terminal domain-containing protein, partial [Pseudomonadales bacterium]
AQRRHLCWRGLPPPAAVREEIARHFAADSDAAGGKRMAYVQPAMTKVVQMAGRLLRDPADRGVICLIDGRFRDPAYQAFFPRHWRPEVIKARDVGRTLENFWRQQWQQAGGFPIVAAVENHIHEPNRNPDAVSQPEPSA